MTDVITVIRLDIEDAEFNYFGHTHHLIATRSDGSRFCCGAMETERGAKMMLKRRAKQFKLTVKDCYAN